MVELTNEETTCSICCSKFSFDTGNTDDEIRKHLPVLSSSRCDHWFCHGCVLREQLRVAEDNNGRVPKWLKCMACREKTSFRPDEPKYHRLLIDLLGRTQQCTATKIKQEGQRDAISNASSDADADERTSPETSKIDEQSSPKPKGDSPAFRTRPSNKAIPTSLNCGEMSASKRKWLSNLNKLKSIIRPDGSLDYSSLDEESQVCMRNFAKVQRKSFRNREANEPSSLTDERYKLPVDAKFNFKPLCGSSKAKGDTKLNTEKKVKINHLPPTSLSRKPTYVEMVHEAIRSLKDRKGSSIFAIGKWIQSNLHYTKPVQAKMFKIFINKAVNKGVKDSRFVRIKNHVKISSDWTKKQKALLRSERAARKEQEKRRGFFLPWKAMWTHMRTEGWTNTRWSGLSEWIYIHPSCKDMRRREMQEEKKRNVHWFDSCDELKRYARMVLGWVDAETRGVCQREERVERGELYGEDQEEGGEAEMGRANELGRCRREHRGGRLQVEGGRQKERSAQEDGLQSKEKAGRRLHGRRERNANISVVKCYQVIPSHEAWSVLMTYYGFSYFAGKYCYPGNEKGSNAEEGVHCFDSIEGLRRHLCAYGLPHDVVLDQETKGKLNRWIRYAIVRNLEDGVTINPKPINQKEAWRLLQRCGLKWKGGYRYNRPRTKAWRHLPEKFKFDYAGDMYKHFARFGVPNELEGMGMNRRTRLSLDLFIVGNSYQVDTFKRFEPSNENFDDITPLPRGIASRGLEPAPEEGKGAAKERQPSLLVDHEIDEQKTSRHFSKRRAHPSTDCKAPPEECISNALGFDCETDNEIDMELTKSEGVSIKEEEKIKYACETDNESG